MGVGRAGIFRGLGRQEQALLAQHLDEPVPPQHHPRLGQGPFEHKMQLARPQARLELPFRNHQRLYQLGIHLPTLPRLAPGVIVLSRNPHLPANRADRYPRMLAFQLYGFMPGWPAAFFLNPATSTIPARLQARRVYARSKAPSMFASARALSNCLTRALRRFSSLISPGLSTRITFPLVPLPYCRTQRDTVSLPLMPYFREMASKAIPPISSSRTTSILKASLYRISSRLPCVFVFMPDNLFQDGTVVMPPSQLSSSMPISPLRSSGDISLSKGATVTSHVLSTASVLRPLVKYPQALRAPVATCEKRRIFQLPAGGVQIKRPRASIFEVRLMTWLAGKSAASGIARTATSRR